MTKIILIGVAVLVLMATLAFGASVAYENAQARRCAAIKADLEVMNMCESAARCEYTYKDLHGLVHTFAACLVRQ